MGFHKLLLLVLLINPDLIANSEINVTENEIRLCYQFTVPVNIELYHDGELILSLMNTTSFIHWFNKSHDDLEHSVFMIATSKSLMEIHWFNYIVREHNSTLESTVITADYTFIIEAIANLLIIIGGFPVIILYSRWRNQNKRETIITAYRNAAKRNLTRVQTIQDLTREIKKLKRKQQ